MAAFAEACAQKGIRLFELAPRSPKLNGSVERANRSFRDEFYDCSTALPTVGDFVADLRRYEHVYSTSAHNKPSTTSPRPSSSKPGTSPIFRRNCHGRLEPAQ